MSYILVDGPTLKCSKCGGTDIWYRQGIGYDSNLVTLYLCADCGHRTEPPPPPDPEIQKAFEKLGEQPKVITF